MRTYINVGVIGTGSMGAQHAQNLAQHAPNARVTATFDVDQTRAAQVAAKCGGASVFTDPYRLIADSSVDAVLVASIDSTHADFVHACLQAGKPVMCEKPLAETAQDALNLVNAELAGGKPLIAVGLMRRFDPQHLAVERAIRTGRIGQALLFRGVHRNAKVPTHLPGQVVITNSAVHDIDSARWLLGKEITEVFVQGVRTQERFSDDTTDMMLLQFRLTGNALATVEVTSAAGYGYEVSAEVIGEHGTVITAQPADAVMRLGGQIALDVDQIWLDRFRQAYIDELIHWTSSIVDGSPFRGASAWDGYRSQVVTDACIQSLISGLPAAVPGADTPPLYLRSRLQEPANAD